MTFLKSKTNLLLLIAIAFVSIFFISRSTEPVEAQSMTLEPGDVSGFAWMGQNISTGASVAEGGGGWLSFNCKPDYCATSDWGVTMDLSETSTKGEFSGQGWSNNYGWLSFEEDDVSSCWTDSHLVVTQFTAKAFIIDGADEATIRGWAKFTAGDDVTDGWDGCVSFDGIYNRSYIDMTNGSIHGWAWGGNVVGWVSFNNPECPECNTSVVLSGTPQLTFWATPTSINVGGSSTLNWTSTTISGNYVASCEDYDNTSNYSHWTSTGMPTAANVGEISVADGNLPNGSHPINNITATTTYKIKCKDKYGVWLPEKTAIVTVNPSATTLELTVSSPTLQIGSGNYDEILKWTSNNPTALHSCVGQFYRASNFTPAMSQNLTGWTGIALPSPIQSNYTAVRDAVAGPNQFATKAAAVFSAVPNIRFIFSISCQDSSNGNAIVYDSAQVQMIGGTTCTDPAAANNGGPLPCMYRACTDPAANNDVLPGPTIITDNSLCTYDPGGGDPVRLSLSVDPQIFYDNASDFDVNLSWTATAPVTNCVGRFTIEDSNPAWDSLAGWTFGITGGNGTLPEPNLTVSNWTQQNTAFSSLLSNETTIPMTYTFRLECEDPNGGPDPVDTASVTLLPWTPVFEPPQVSLRIISPNIDPAPTVDNNFGVGSEIISATAGHDSVVLRWQDLNTSTCSASSIMYDNATGTNPMWGANADWNFEIPQDLDPTNNTMTLDITDPAVIHPTKFLITCIPDDPAYMPPSVPSLPTAWVCLGLSGLPFPACSVDGAGGPGVPTYIEI